MDCKQTHTQIDKIEETDDYGNERVNNEVQRLWYCYGNSNQRTMEITEMQQVRLM